MISCNAMCYAVIRCDTYMKLNKTRTIRFGPEDLRQIEEFLRRNPFLDFSTLVRIAVVKFMEKPSLEVRSVSPNPAAMSSRTKGGAK